MTGCRAAPGCIRDKRQVAECCCGVGFYLPHRHCRATSPLLIKPADYWSRPRIESLSLPLRRWAAIIPIAEQWISLVGTGWGAELLDIYCLAYCTVRKVQEISMADTLFVCVMRPPPRDRHSVLLCCLASRIQLHPLYANVSSHSSYVN